MDYGKLAYVRTEDVFKRLQFLEGTFAAERTVEWCLNAFAVEGQGVERDFSFRMKQSGALTVEALIEGTCVGKVSACVLLDGVPVWSGTEQGAFTFVIARRLEAVPFGKKNLKVILDFETQSEQKAEVRNCRLRFTGKGLERASTSEITSAESDALYTLLTSEKSELFRWENGRFFHQRSYEKLTDAVLFFLPSVATPLLCYRKADVLSCFDGTREVPLADGVRAFTLLRQGDEYRCLYGTDKGTYVVATDFSSKSFASAEFTDIPVADAYLADKTGNYLVCAKDGKSLLYKRQPSGDFSYIGAYPVTNVKEVYVSAGEVNICYRFDGNLWCICVNPQTAVGTPPALFYYGESLQKTDSGFTVCAQGQLYFSNERREK